ncbi:MAG: preprotein translocase subunit SecG [Candidatus Omnitrophica bacterium CG12_big_fil_rev_8_21_14_0_65_43_15]|uniref:Protein-export membrane protein SecG n=1 Tax=Candidatus Taenaricola geysiri TaxID=1974752 RepID=A0A2J0LES6_9BACT|nr:MAG: preprotein translocase subunit SecG [Candidatus Omnitrophica bacterium CG10_big_fil_rev_8_21_14_0_10_43_8]PIW66361.1 MAG: preprotein translocase subunit SecG [Candidatus Omnitrophica bacterium CG12_big_fil_rev_8_21_14_0_65_43_15]PIW80961.1 MAG: preprotein translocase subunit SecG [Candidatus Omnitrophica bacterium CG_4_8_14_3_um_filter_43_15]PJC46062.1 MAG: preprotein translocase subunit SecG [Candidatus Omnitrophica bacterium CG_4_9_14_0_2_um_filter_43_12]
MYAFMIVIHILASIFLIAVILFQAGRGGGLTETFGGGAMQNMFGSSANMVMTKVTAACAIVFIITSLSLTILTTRRSKSLIDLERSKVADVIIKQKQQPAATVPAAAPVSPLDAKKTVTVREVKIDPETGKEIVVKEEKMTPEEAAAKQQQ